MTPTIIINGIVGIIIMIIMGIIPYIIGKIYLRSTNNLSINSVGRIWVEGIIILLTLLFIILVIIMVGELMESFKISLF